PTEEAVLMAIDAFAKVRDDKYPQIRKSWRAHRENLNTLFSYPLKLSKLIVVPTAGMGFYSRKINSLDALKKGDIITLSNDPTNL
ncbi:MetQ/NlpA family ABC transporter substrate-binding protein, partial [Salmonella enterica subsp. enterica serovar Agona]|nr:MetQ/NlpA family ABC transporter substrate-binding protein [Salmonella enterica subsp. enterica serovar Agona]